MSLKYTTADDIKLAKPLDLSPGSICDFVCIITKRERDRDGDLLEPAGAEIDEGMPLLWQHKPDQPIGKLVKVLNKNRDELRARFAVADTPLGRDAATLLEFGALRISHGFKPLESEPMSDSRGWHVKRFEVYETSAVSIPALPSARVEAVQRRKYYTPEAQQLVASLDPEYQRLWQASLGGKSRYELDAEDFRRRVLAPRTAAPVIDQQAVQAMVKALRSITDDMRRAKHDLEVERACRELLGW